MGTGGQLAARYHPEIRTKYGRIGSRTAQISKKTVSLSPCTRTSKR